MQNSTDNCCSRNRTLQELVAVNVVENIGSDWVPGFNPSVRAWHVCDRNNNAAASIPDLIGAVVQKDHDLGGIRIKGSKSGVIVVSRHNRTVMRAVG